MGFEVGWFTVVHMWNTGRRTEHTCFVLLVQGVWLSTSDFRGHKQSTEADCSVSAQCVDAFDGNACSGRHKCVGAFDGNACGGRHKCVGAFGGNTCGGRQEEMTWYGFAR